LKKGRRCAIIFVRVYKTIVLEDEMRNPDLLAEAKDYRGKGLQRQG
jgi:hypothetical protein